MKRTNTSLDYYQATEPVEQGCGCYFAVVSALIVISIVLIVVL